MKRLLNSFQTLDDSDQSEEFQEAEETDELEEQVVLRMHVFDGCQDVVYRVERDAGEEIHEEPRSQVFSEKNRTNKGNF